VLLLNTEGATAPAVFQALTGQTAAEVCAAQQHWLLHEGLRPCLP
jgi:beta-ureidopropionase / N-carbamoyl-L-amino-acid hydrolase